MSQSNPPDKNSLVMEKIKAGDKAALLDLYESNLSMVSNHILKNNGSRDEAKDILHDSLIVLWNNIRKPDFKLTSKPSTYIMAVSKNLWLKKLS